LGSATHPKKLMNYHELSRMEAANKMVLRITAGCGTRFLFFHSVGNNHPTD
jgi:hypothetical protein